MRSLAFDQSPVPMLILDVDEKFTILDCNKAHNDVTNTKRESVLFKGVFDVFPNADPSHEKNLRYSFQKAIATGEVDRMPIMRYDIKGEDGLWIEKFWTVENQPLILDGKVVKVLNIAMDVSTIAKAINMSTGEMSKGMKEAIDRGAAMTKKTDDNIVIIKGRTLVIIVAIFLLIMAFVFGYFVLDRGAKNADNVNRVQDSTIISNDKK